jgi:uncharacterized Fe-S cluster-containing protein
MKHKDCSFCGKSAPDEIAEAKLMSGKEATICRNCLELMLEVFARKDKSWRDRTIFSLRSLDDRK